MKYVSTTLVFVVSAFLALGLVMLYSSMMVHRGGSFMGGQLLWCLIGLVICAVVAQLDYQLLKKIILI